MATTVRRKYRFADRQTAENEYHRKDVEAIRAYHVAMNYRAGKVPPAIVCKVCGLSAEIVSKHATTGRDLSVGPILVLTELAGGYCQILDLYQWADENRRRPSSTFWTDADYALREFAEKLYFSQVAPA